MMRITSELHQPKLNINDSIVRKSMLDGVNAVTLGFQTEVKRSITKKKLVDTGRLRSSMMADINNMTGKVGSDVKYARIHEFGGIIKPKRAKVLVFEVTSSNRIMSLNGKRRLKKAVANKSLVFAKQVKIKEKRYFRDAIVTFNPKMKRILENVMESAAMRMSGGSS